MNNFQKIKAMNIEGMAEIIAELLLAVLQKNLQPIYAALAIIQPDLSQDDKKEVIKHIKEWLKSESEG